MWSESVGDTFRMFTGHFGADPKGCCSSPMRTPYSGPLEVTRSS